MIQDGLPKSNIHIVITSQKYMHECYKIDNDVLINWKPTQIMTIIDMKRAKAHTRDASRTLQVVTVAFGGRHSTAISTGKRKDDKNATHFAVVIGWKSAVTWSQKIRFHST